MTTIAAEALGRRWISAGGGWHAGMLAVERVRPDAYDTRLMSGRIDGLYLNRWADPDEQKKYGWWPDPRDPAVLGWMLAIVRERYTNGTIFVRPTVAGFVAYSLADTGNARLIAGPSPSEGEALVSALERAK